MELRQMVMTINQLQSSGLRGAVIYDYFEKITFIFSTHDQRVIDRARRVVTLEDGKIVNDIKK